MSVSIGKTDRRVILTTGLRAAAALIRWNAWRLYRGVSAASRPCYLARPPPPPPSYPRLSSLLSPRGGSMLIGQISASVANTHRRGETGGASAVTCLFFFFFLSFFLGCSTTFNKKRGTRNSVWNFGNAIFEESRKIFLDYGDGEL